MMGIIPAARVWEWTSDPISIARQQPKQPHIELADRVSLKESCCAVDQPGTAVLAAGATGETNHVRNLLRAAAN